MVRSDLSKNILKNMSKLVFISSPYSNPDENIKEENYKKVAKYATFLCKSGITAISPIVYGHELLKNDKSMSSDWSFWENFCLNLMKKCDEIHVLKLNGWEKSVGVREEIEFANTQNINIVYVDEESHSE